MKRLVTAVCCACAIGAAGLSAAQADKMDKGKMSKDTMPKDKDKMGMAMHDVLHVKSVKMLASSCS